MIRGLEDTLHYCFVKQNTEYEMRMSDWSSDVCSSDLEGRAAICPACGVTALPSSCRTSSTLASPARTPTARPTERTSGPSGGINREIGSASCRDRVWQSV